MSTNEPTVEPLVMSFDPHTVEHLGVKMYANLPNAMAELIANAYDADAKCALVNLYDKDGVKEIVVADDGEGMSYEEVNTEFLRIGRKRREQGKTLSPSGKRKVTGKKGLGKLAFFGIGNVIKVETIKRGSGIKTIFTLSWDDLITTTGRDYHPKYSTEECDKELSGTSIALSELKRKSAFDKDSLALSISKLFNFLDEDFRVFISVNDDKALEVTNKIKYEAIVAQFEWEFPEFTEKVDYEYTEKENIKGNIYSTEKPLRPGYRGITLYANGRMVNAQEFFGISESSHGFSYFTGWLDVDFVDDWKEDVIATDRQSLNWDLPNTTELRNFLKKAMSALEKSWREKRNEERRNKIKEKTKVDVPTWYAHLPKEVLDDIEPVINMIVDDSELPVQAQEKAVQSLHALIPEYPHYHWRHLHKEVQDASSEAYNKAEFYTAFMETVKRYIRNAKSKSGSTNSSDHSMMAEIFGKEANGKKKKLTVTKKYKKPNGTEFDQRTKDNIEEGQREFSQGLVSGVRNPIAHEEVVNLRDSELFSEKDCLDALSLLSHLFKRLDDAELN